VGIDVFRDDTTIDERVGRFSKGALTQPGLVALLALVSGPSRRRTWATNFALGGRSPSTSREPAPIPGFEALRERKSR